MQITIFAASTRRTRRALTLAGLVTLCGATAALAAQPAPGAHFSGKTKQGRKISLVVSRNGKRVGHPSFYLVIRCSNGNSSFASSSSSNKASASIKPSGAFSIRFAESATFGGGLGGTVVMVTAKYAINGRFTSRTRVSGTASVTERTSTGVICRSGNVKFTLKS